MNFENIRTKLIKNSWLLIVTTLVSNLLFLSNVSAPTYLATITVGMNLNNPQYQNVMTSSSTFASNTYDKTLQEISLYLSNRFASPEIQNEVSENAKLGAKIDTKKPFYEVKNQAAGFVNLSYIGASKSEGESFVSSVNNVFYSKIVTEWNKERSQLFAVEQVNKNKIDFNNSIIEVKPPTQNKLLPTVVGLLVGIALIFIFVRNKQNSVTISNT